MCKAQEVTATKDDLTHAIDDLRKDVRDVESRLNAKIDNLEVRIRGELLLLKWMLGAVFTGIVALVGLLARVLFLLQR